MRPVFRSLRRTRQSDTISVISWGIEYMYENLPRGFILYLGSYMTTCWPTRKLRGKALLSS